MAYSMAGLIALFVTIVVNFNVFRRNKTLKDVIPARNYYRYFLISVCAYYLCDAGWGIFDYLHNKAGLYAITYCYFVAMAVSVFMWARYTVEYLGRKNHFGNLLIIFGWMFISAQIVLLSVNPFVPVFFSFDPNNNYAYVAGGARYVSLFIQLGMFLVTAIYSMFIWWTKREDTRHKYITMGLTAFSMSILVIFQIIFPLAPLYSLGYLAGTCILHTFVIEGAKADYRKRLESLIESERKQKEELDYAKLLVSTDPLTGVKSKHAYVEIERQFDERMGYSNQREFSIVVFDLNDLKEVNDSLGHDAGDQYIKNGVELITGIYRHSPVYRVGGDEFVAILEVEDYLDRVELLDRFNKLIDENLEEGKVVIAAGMADYDKTKDFSLRALFARADQLMYERKRQLKASHKKLVS